MKKITKITYIKHGGKRVPITDLGLETTYTAIVKILRRLKRITHLSLEADGAGDICICTEFEDLGGRYTIDTTDADALADSLIRELKEDLNIQPIAEVSKAPKKLVTIRNDFHGTSAKVRVVATHEQDCNDDARYSWVIQPTEAQYASLKKELCGIAGCACGGIRGPQKFKGENLEILQPIPTKIRFLGIIDR